MMNLNGKTMSIKETNNLDRNIGIQILIFAFDNFKHHL